MVVTEKLLRLFVANPTIHQDKSTPYFDEERSHRPCAQVLGVWRIGVRPKLLRHHPKHCSAIQFEISGVNRVQSHGAKVDTAHATSVPGL